MILFILFLFSFTRIFAQSQDHILCWSQGNLVLYQVSEFHQKLITQPFSYRDLIYPTSACPLAKMLPPPLKPHLRQLMEATTKRLKQTIQMVKISCLFTNEKKNSHQFLAHFCPNLTLFHILSLPNPILFVKTRCHFSTSLIFSPIEWCNMLWQMKFLIFFSKFYYWFLAFLQNIPLTKMKWRKAKNYVKSVLSPFFMKSMKFAKLPNV